MEKPTIETRVEDNAKGVVFRLLGYRVLTREEASLTVAAYLRQCGKRKPKKGDVITITTVFR